jgi:cytochrome b6-f complex iron-sulfur subunit
MTVDRRKFLQWFGIGWVISIVSGAIAACTNTSSNNTETPAKTPSEGRSDGFLQVGTVEDLNKKGQLSDNSSANPILVVRDPNDAEKIVAVNPTCTHQGCTVDWKADKKQSICSCHGSTFGVTGEVITGPASKALKQYEIKREGDIILVRTS